MTIRFEDIKVHDIVLINNGDDWNGWHIVTGKWKDFFDAEALGNNGMTFVIFDEDVEEIVKKHLRISAVPGAIETLEHINEYWNRDPNEKAMADALWHIIETSDDALRAVRGEEVSDETHRTSIPTPDESHAD